MKEIKFYKNDIIQKIDKKNIHFDFHNVTIYKYEKDYTILLDFKNKLCNMKLIEYDQSVLIEVEVMDYTKMDNTWIFEYKLTSEEDTINKIIIVI